MLPYWFSAMTMKSVGKAALAMVEEVRRQFSEIPGLMEGTARPDYRRCVEISTAVGSLPLHDLHPGSNDTARRYSRVLGTEPLLVASLCCRHPCLR